MAHVAVPLNEGGVGFLEHKAVGAVAWLSHCNGIPESGVGIRKVLVLRLMLAGSV